MWGRGCAGGVCRVGCARASHLIGPLNGRPMPCTPRTPVACQSQFRDEHFSRDARFVLAAWPAAWPEAENEFARLAAEVYRLRDLAPTHACAASPHMRVLPHRPPPVAPPCPRLTQAVLMAVFAAKRLREIGEKLTSARVKGGCCVFHALGMLNTEPGGQPGNRWASAKGAPHPSRGPVLARPRACPSSRPGPGPAPPARSPTQPPARARTPPQG